MIYQGGKRGKILTHQWLIKNAAIAGVKKPHVGCCDPVCKNKRPVIGGRKKRSSRYRFNDVKEVESHPG